MLARAFGLSLAVAIGVTALPALAQSTTSASAAAPASKAAAVDATHRAQNVTRKLDTSSIKRPARTQRAAIVPPAAGACTTNRRAAFALAMPPQAQSATEAPETVIAVPVTPTTGDYFANIQQQTTQRELIENCARGNRPGVSGI